MEVTCEGTVAEIWLMEDEPLGWALNCHSLRRLLGGRRVQTRISGVTASGRHSQRHGGQREAIRK